MRGTRGQSGEHVIETWGLTKHFGSVRALTGVDLKLKAGVTALLGPNGAGKTTFIKLLLGLIRPTHGSAKIFGLNCRKEALAIHRQIGVLHEKPFFPKALTVYRFLFLMGKLFSLPNLDTRITNILQAVELWDARDRKIGHLSAGMLQRLGLAQALLPEPKLIFLDEPTANLDPLGRIRIINLIRQFAIEQSISFLISSHILHDLEQVCNYVVILDRGQLRLQGELDQLLQQRDISVVTIRSFDERVKEALVGFSDVESVNQVMPSTFECRIKDLPSFQAQLFQWATQEQVQIESLNIENSLERIYADTITSGEGSGS